VGISYSQNFPKSRVRYQFSRTNYSPNYSQKFDQKLPSGSDTSFHAQTIHKSLIKNWLLTPECISHSITKKYIANPHPEGSFYSIFCEKIVFIEQYQIGALPISISAGIAGYIREEVGFGQVVYANSRNHAASISPQSNIR